jgi:hypothetical protein
MKKKYLFLIFLFILFLYPSVFSQEPYEKMLDDWDNFNSQNEIQIYQQLLDDYSLITEENEEIENTKKDSKVNSDFSYNVEEKNNFAIYIIIAIIIGLVLFFVFKNKNNKDSLEIIRNKESNRRLSRKKKKE